MLVTYEVFLVFRAVTETAATVTSQGKPTVRGDRERSSGTNAVPGDERVPSSVGRASNPNKAEIPERAGDRSRRGKTQRVCTWFSLVGKVLQKIFRSEKKFGNFNLFF